jgi:hypothetical protein
MGVSPDPVRRRIVAKAKPKIEAFPVTGGDATHVIIELFGGDNNLSQYVEEDLQEMAAGNNGPFAMIGLADFLGEGARVVELSPSKGISVIEEAGEIDTGDPETLATFIARAIVSYPKAQHRALGFWDHGSGVFDETDENEVDLERRLRSVARRSRSRSVPARKLFIPKAEIAANPRLRAMLHDDTTGGVLTNFEASRVVKAAFAWAGFKGRFDLVFSDTCLNGMIEVLDQFRPYAEVIVGSEDLEPGDGWDYERFFRMMSDNPPATAEAWGDVAVAAFEDGYRNRPNEHPCTMGAFRSDNTMTDRFKDLVGTMKPLGRDGYRTLSFVRAVTQGFARRDTYDILDFTKRLSEEDASLKKPAAALAKAFEAARVRSTALGDAVQDAQGLAFWFPSDKWAYQSTAGTYRRLEFDKAAGWSDYVGTYLA